MQPRRLPDSDSDTREVINVGRPLGSANDRVVPEVPHNSASGASHADAAPEPPLGPQRPPNLA
eukprot:2314685-Lingulodinium_polyedra.AAC.1